MKLALQAGVVLALVVALIIGGAKACSGCLPGVASRGIWSALWPASPASSASRASSSSSSASRTEAAEAAQLRTTAVDQAPTLERKRTRTTYYRPDGAVDHVTDEDREVLHGARHEATEAAGFTSSSSASTSTRSSSSSSSFTSSTPATWALVWGPKLAPGGVTPAGLVGLERRLLGPLWLASWAAPGPLELGAGVRLELGRVSLLYAPELLPVPQLVGLVGLGVHLGGPFDVGAWLVPLSSAPRAGAALRVAW